MAATNSTGDESARDDDGPTRQSGSGDVHRTSPPLWVSTTLPAAAILLISVVFPPERMPDVALCHFRRLTALDCPGCGLTRSFTSIAHGRFDDAFGFHPLGFVFFLLTLLLLGYPLIVRWAPSLDARIPRLAPVFAAVLLVAMLVHGIARWIW